MSQKNETNPIEVSSRNSSSEEPGEKKGRSTTHQKITLPIFEKKTIQEAKLWWRRFIQYVKMTQKIDLNRMTTDKEIIEEYREELEIKIKDIFIWALGEEAVTEMTKTVRDNDPNKMNINQLYSLFRLHFIPERNKFHSRADFFGIVREPNETAEDVWTRILQTEKNCEFDNVTPAELIASKFLSLIGRSTGDYELKKKIRKSNMTIETITDLIHEYMYDRLNDSNNSNDGRNVKHVQERPQKRKWSEKSSYERNKRRPEYQKQKYKDNRCGQCGAPNWSRQHVCPARTVECRNCKKKGHYEKMCRLPKRIQYVDKISSSAEEDNWDYNKIQSINNKKKKEDFFHATLLVNDVPIKFIIDSGSPVTLIPQKLFKGTSEVTKLNTNYKDVNDNKIEFRGQTLATVKTNNTTLQLPLLITKANITPLMGLDWMNRLGITLNTTTEDVKIHNIKLDETQKKILKLKNEFKDLFYNNTEIKNLSVKINLKADAKIIQQKGRPVPIHLQEQVANEIKRLIKNGYLERATEITENCFVSPAVITVKKDKSIKIALDSRKLNEATIKRKAQMPNMEELISRISRKISEEKEGEIWLTKLDFDYAYGQIKLDDETKNLCIFTITGGEFTGYYRFLKGFYGLADIPTIFQERIDKTLEFKHPAWLDDIIIVTKGTIDKHEAEVKETMENLEKAGYRLHPNKCEFFKQETEWIGHKIDQNGIRPLQDKLEAITKIEIPKNEKELKSFLGAIQYLAKYIENLSAQTDILRKLLKKQNEWNWTQEHTEAFNNLKKLITQLPCLAHYNTDNENILTTDASTKGLGATLWQKQKDGNLKPIGFASRFLSDTEKKYAINELELLAVVWGLEHFRLYIYGKPIELLTDHQALEPLIKRNRSNKTYSARLTRWLDRLAHFDINIKHVAGKHLTLTDYLSRNPVAKPVPIENYDEEYVINCIIPLLEFINTHGSISDEKKATMQTENNTAKQNNNQSQTRSVNKQPLTINQINERKPFQTLQTSEPIDSQHKFDHRSINMDIKTIGSIEKDDPSEDTLRLTSRWREITKPGDYRFTQGQWRKYAPPRTLRAELKRIEVDLWQRRNKLIWQKMEKNSKETPEEVARKKEFHRVIEKIRNLPKRDEAGPSSSNTQQQQPQYEEENINADQRDETETMSSDSDQTIAVPAINFKRYLGATSVRYIQMGTASKVQYEDKWDLEETVRQAEQKFSTDLRTIADETTNDEKLLKTLVCLERRNFEQIPEEYKQYKNNLSTRFGVVFYDDKIVIPKPLRQTVIMLLHKGHPAINKMSHAARPFWWPKLTKDIQTKCNECIPCKMSGKSIKPQLPMTEINYLPPAEKPNQEIQLDFIGPIRFKHRRFYILISIDRYSRWPAACICEAPNSKTAKKFLGTIHCTKRDTADNKNG